VRRRILVIDDEEGVRDAFELALDETRYEVVTAADGLEGLKRAAEATPDLVILDLKMPHMDGVETRRRLRVQCPGVSVYILSSIAPAPPWPRTRVARPRRCGPSCSPPAPEPAWPRPCPVPTPSSPRSSGATAPSATWVWSAFCSNLAPEKRRTGTWPGV